MYIQDNIGKSLLQSAEPPQDFHIASQMRQQVKVKFRSRFVSLSHCEGKAIKGHQVSAANKLISKCQQVIHGRNFCQR